MRKLRKGTPGRGDAARPDSFSYTPVLHGLKNAWNGWVAGECYWAEEAHEHKPPAHIGTQPCMHWMTNGEVRCARCRKQPAAVPIGWLPVWREQDHHACIVILHKDVFDLVRELTFGAFVLIGRVDPTSSVYVRRSESKQVMRTDNEYRKNPVDITTDLLTMWKLPDLNEWLKRGAVGPVGFDVSEATDETRELAKQQFSPTMRAAAIRFGAVKPEGASGVDDAMTAIQKRTKEAETNGKHDKKGGA